MKHVRIVLLALLLVPGALAAQGSNVSGAVTPKSTSGDFALLFDLGGLANMALNGFNSLASDTSELGSGIGLKYFVADDIALRLGLTFMSMSVVAPVGPDSLGLEDRFSSLRFAIAPSLTVNLVKSGPVAGYVGGQISYGMGSSSNTPSDTTERAVDASSSTFGVGAIIGAEWFPWSNVSLSGEYVLGFATSSEEREEQIGSAPSQSFALPSETTIGLRARGVITASIYW